MVKGTGLAQPRFVRLKYIHSLENPQVRRVRRKLAAFADEGGVKTDVIEGAKGRCFSRMDTNSS